MNKLFYKDKPLIGLDISQTSIKVMSIDSQHWRVLGYGSIELDPAKMHDALENATSDYLTASIKSLMQDKIIGTLGSNHAAIGLPTGRTFSRTFTLPANQEKNITGAVAVEVEQYIPMPASSLYIEHDIIERTKDQLTIALCAIPKSLVDSSVQACTDAGLRPVLIEPSIHSVARVLERTEEGHLSTLVVDIGPANTDIAILEGGAVRVSGGLGVGGNTFTIDIAKHLKIPLENAHQIKVLNGLNTGPRQAKVSAALTPSLQRIVLETKKVIRYYVERLEENRKIEQVLIVGGGSNVPGIGEYFTSELVMASRVASPWQQLDFAGLTEPAKQFRPRYISAAGLASINYKEIWQ